MRLLEKAKMVGLATALPVLILLGLLTHAQLGKMRTERDLALIQAIDFQTTQLRTSLFGYLLRPALSSRDQVEAQFDVVAALVSREPGGFVETRHQNPHDRELWMALRRAIEDIRTLFRDLSDRADDAHPSARDQRTQDLILANNHALSLYISQIRHRANDRFFDATAAKDGTLLGVLVMVTGLGLLLFLMFKHRVLAPIQRLHGAALQVSAGDWDLRIRSTRHDELGELADAFDRMLDKLRDNAELEERVRQRTAELESANRELESFAYAVSHDLRAPLRALSGFSQALVEDHGDRLDGEARVFLDQIQSASRRMGELIDGILTLSRSTRGTLRHEILDLSVTAGKILAERVAAEPGRRIDWWVAPGLQARCDPAMLEIVLVNLIDNALKYTAKTTEARIRVECVTRAGRPWLRVVDNGAGFEMAYAERLFQPFQRLHRQDEFPGVGVGLATVQRIIHRHGGTIEAIGSTGAGATFMFTLPTLICADTQA